MPATAASAAHEFFARGEAALSANDPAAAEKAFRAALEHDPQFAEAAGNLALTLESTGRFSEAEACYRHALTIMPANSRAWSNFGIFLAKLKRFAEAEEAHRQAIALSPHSPGAWSNLGVLYASLQRDREAESCHRTALAFDPDYRAARFNLSYVLLRHSRWEEGWAHFEARPSSLPYAQLLPCPRWQGESIADKRVLLVAEGGQGDTLQFCRYSAMLKAQGCRTVDLLVQAPLVSLLGYHLSGADHVYSLTNPLPEINWDYWCPLFSLPYRCHSTPDHWPATLPYLQAPPERIALISPNLASEKTKVGLVWKGNPNFENDADRSLASLGELAPLAEIPGITFFSLQKGAGEDEAMQPPFPIINLAPYLHDFADTAAAISKLDLIITVDTSAAHLAAALGKPTWVLIPAHKPDWRWGAGRSDSPWYPGVLRLFRQQAIGSWRPVINDIATALKKFSIGM